MSQSADLTCKMGESDVQICYTCIELFLLIDFKDILCNRRTDLAF